jgi:hypothetical protein
LIDSLSVVESFDNPFQLIWLKSFISYFSGCIVLIIPKEISLIIMIYLSDFVVTSVFWRYPFCSWWSSLRLHIFSVFLLQFVVLLTRMLVYNMSECVIISFQTSSKILVILYHPSSSYLSSTNFIYCHHDYSYLNAFGNRFNFSCIAPNFLTYEHIWTVISLILI